MKFSIVTPSFRSSNWLKLCIASVADQQGVELEHIVQDSCSDDGTQDWLPHDRRVKAFIEKDGGMYDAVIHERGIFFDTHWRVVGDLHWVVAMMKNKVPMAVCDSFTSVFTDTGDNLCLSPAAIEESRETLAMPPGWVRASRPAWVAHHHLRRLAAGHFFLKPASYSIYTLQTPEKRVQFDALKPTALWRNRR